MIASINSEGVPRRAGNRRWRGSASTYDHRVLDG
jgi:hypothetical protein